MEQFAGLSLNNIRVVETIKDTEIALADLMQHPVLGFDTESRPTFRKGEASEGPHVLQFATSRRAYVFQSHSPFCAPAIGKIIASKTIAKIGFGLNDDIKRIAEKFKIEPNAIIDLNRTFNRLGYKNSIGARTAIAFLFNKRLTKSKSATTSNWSMKLLTDKQVLYAANDAYAALCAYEALKGKGITVG